MCVTANSPPDHWGARSWGTPDSARNHKAYRLAHRSCRTLRSCLYYPHKDCHRHLQSVLDDFCDSAATDMESTSAVCSSTICQTLVNCVRRPCYWGCQKTKVKKEIGDILTNAYPHQHSPKVKSTLQQPAVFCQFIWYTKAAKVTHAVTLTPLATCTSMSRPWLIPMPLHGRLNVR